MLKRNTYFETNFMLKQKLLSISGFYLFSVGVLKYFRLKNWVTEIRWLLFRLVQKCYNQCKQLIQFKSFRKTVFWQRAVAMETAHSAKFTMKCFFEKRRKGMTNNDKDPQSRTNQNRKGTPQTTKSSIVKEENWFQKKQQLNI